MYLCKNEKCINRTEQEKKKNMLSFQFGMLVTQKFSTRIHCDVFSLSNFSSSLSTYE